MSGSPHPDPTGAWGTPPSEPTGGWGTPPDPYRRWGSGQWSLELRGDRLDQVRYAGRRVLRGIRAVVRDRDWATARLVVDGVEQADTSLTVRVHTRDPTADLHGTVLVRVAGGTLEVLLDLTAGAGYRTNRTGLVVLHPPEVAGAPLTVTHPDGAVEQTAFPESISPHQPARGIAGLAWTDDGVRAEVRFTGDVFEMEDQRNWTDASFKTYSRPLALPFPYRLAAGDRVRQSVTVTARVLAPAGRRADPDRLRLLQGPEFPEIALGAATDPDPAPEFPPIGGAVLVELDLGSPNWRAALDRAAASGVPLDVRLILPPGGAPAESAATELAAVATRLAPLPVVRVAGFDPASHITDAAAARAVRSALRAAGVAAPVVGGARSHFTELNREHHRIPADLDGIGFGLTPLFHDLDTVQLVESVAMQRLVAHQAVEIAAGRPVHIGPVTLRPRFNNVATTPLPGPARSDLSGGYGARFTGSADPRQSAPALAAWTIASAAALAIPGVTSIAYFEQWGTRGVYSGAGEPLPVAAAVRELAALRGTRRLWAASPDGLIWAVGGQRDRRLTLLLANLDSAPRTVTVDCGPAGEARATIDPYRWIKLHL